MGKIYFTFFLLFFGCTLNAQIDWDAVKDRYYEKYQPAASPDWLFPIIFKDGAGAQDTIFLGYDEDAFIGFPSDTIFGEYYVPVDSFSFQSYWAKCPASLCDSLEVLDVNMLGGIPSAWFTIEFHNGVLPVTMYFDASFLSDAALPYPDQSPAPPAQIDIGFDLPLETIGANNNSTNCIYFDYLLLSDTALYPNASCVYTDSIVFISDPDIPNVTYMSWFWMRLDAWDGAFYTSTIELSKEDIMFIYPNPAREKINIDLAKVTTGQIYIYNVEGQRMLSQEFNSTQHLEINTMSIPSGMYFIELRTDHLQLINKLSIVK